MIIILDYLIRLCRVVPKESFNTVCLMRHLMNVAVRHHYVMINIHMPLKQFKAKKVEHAQYIKVFGYRNANQHLLTLLLCFSSPHVII